MWLYTSQQSFGNELALLKTSLERTIIVISWVRLIFVFLNILAKFISNNKSLLATHSLCLLSLPIDSSSLPYSTLQWSLGCNRVCSLFILRTSNIFIAHSFSGMIYSTNIQTLKQDYGIWCLWIFQQLKTLAALTENLGVIPSTHMEAHKYLWLEFQIIPHSLLASVGTRYVHDSHAYMQANIQTYKVKAKNLKKDYTILKLSYH